MNKFKVLVWSLFDFGNSSYAIIIVAFVYAVYFTDVVCGKAAVGDFYWSLGIVISMFLSAVINPIGGAIADKLSNKKSFLFFFTILCVVPTALMYFTGPGKIFLGLLLFIISNIGFQSGLAFYDALISNVVEEKYYNKVSGIGYAVGYIGSLVSLGLVFAFTSSESFDYNLLFVVCAMFFTVFSVPLFIFLKEEKRIGQYNDIKFFQYVVFGVKKVIDTLININKYRNLKNYLLAYFLYIDAVNTIIFFSGIYARKTLNLSYIELAIFFIIVQITAMVGSLIFAYLGDRLGVKKSIFITLLFWTVIVFFIFFYVRENTFITINNYQFHIFFLVGGFAGTFLGATQSLSRALMAKLTPDEIKAEFFGFYSLFEKTSTLIGPLTFGLVSYLTESQNFAVLSIGVFFILGIIMLGKVKEEFQM
ncbi:MAG: MFS transporter [Ignavibacteria bacterium]|nr:MFS transporter [Ignavibacteria bacterium]